MRTPTLLIADDEQTLRETLGEVFRPWGFRTFLAADGEEVLDILRAHEIHLALLDLHMPKLSGLEAVRVARQHKLLLPCILASTEFDEVVLSQARVLRIVRFLPKPFSLRQVVETVLLTWEENYGSFPGKSLIKGVKNGD